MHHTLLLLHLAYGDLGLEIETVEDPMYVSSPLGARVCIDRICQGYELEISEIQLTVDLRVMDVTEFDIILEMDWLATHRVVIYYDRKRVTTYALEDVYVKFPGEKLNVLSHAVYDSL